MAKIFYKIRRKRPNEKNLPTKEAPTQQGAWFPAADAHTIRKKCSQKKKEPRKKETLGIKEEKMLPKEHRLQKNRHFNYIYKHGNSKHAKTLSVVFVKTKFQPYKVGFTVSKKVGKSVVRSKVKRRLREAFKKMNADKNFNYIFIAREGIDLQTYVEIEATMKELLIRAGLYVSA